jgi:hypothetical protein
MILADQPLSIEFDSIIPQDLLRAAVGSQTKRAITQ